MGQTAPGVPPTFATVAEFAVFRQIVSDPELDLDFARVVHGDQEYEWHRPPAVGETLVVAARIAAIRERGRSRVPHDRDGPDLPPPASRSRPRAPR